MARIIVLSAMTALSDAAVKVAAAVMITILPYSGQRCEQESGGDQSFSAWHSEFLSSTACDANRGDD
jgi:hypothetical protein